MDNIVSPNKDQFNCTFPTQNTVTAPSEKKNIKKSLLLYNFLLLSSNYAFSSYQSVFNYDKFLIKF